MASKSHVRGTKLSVDASGGSSYSEIADVAAITAPQLKRATAETTVMQSPNGYREFIKGWKDGDTAGFRLRFVKASYVIMRTIFEDDTTAVPAWEITFPLVVGEATPSVLVFSGILTDFGMPEFSVDGEDIIEIEATIKVTGSVSFTAGA